GQPARQQHGHGLPSPSAPLPQSAVPGGEEVRQLQQQQPEAGCLRICTE
ncbi:hypothetical protein E3A20_21060, partial [Planctomyces bekefii]